MIITLNKEILHKNIIFQIERAIDKLGDEKYKSLYLTPFFSEWIDRQLTTINYDICKLLTPILNEDIEDDSIYYFDIDIKHPLQQKILPQLIEETFIFFAVEMWCIDTSIPIHSRTNINLDDIKSLALRSAMPITRRYRIIY